VIASPNHGFAFTLRHGRADARTFAAFGEIYAQALASDARVFTVDCSGLAFCSGNLSAAVQVLKRQVFVQGRLLEFINFQPTVKSVLDDAGLHGAANQRPRSTVIPMAHFVPGESGRFDLYAESGLRGKGLPQMSRSLEQHFFTGIHELFTNFEIHSQSPLAWACGQLLPQRGRIEMTLVDQGVGFAAKIMSRGYASTPHQAIDWAMTGVNTTREGDVPGGLGLKILREFIALNEGEITIASQGGFWCERAGRKTLRPLAHPFPGTAVTIAVNTNLKDKKSYKMAAEVRPGDIF
jgi:hypothetical protein